MVKKKVLLRAPLISISGYGEHSRFVLRSLLKFEDLFDIYLITTNWGRTTWDHADTKERQLIDTLLQKTIQFQQSGGQFDMSIQVTIPNEFQRLAPINIGITAGIETNKVSPKWIEGCNLMDRVITISQHAKEGLVNSVYSAQNKQTMEIIQEYRCIKPVHVIGYPVKKQKELDIGIDFDYDFNYLCVAQWSVRKNIENTIGWFVEEFKDKEVGLVLKLSFKCNSIMDRIFVEKKLKILLSRIKDCKCKVYLLHGYMTEEEMNALYKHPKIKAFISIPHGEGFCGLDYTPIITNKGIKRLDEMKIGDKVLTHLGNFKNVKKIMSREYCGNMKKIIPYMSQDKEPIILTENHNIYCFDPSEGKYLWKEASVLNKGDILCIPKPNFSTIEQKKYINILDYIDLDSNLVENDNFINYKQSNKLGYNIPKIIELNKDFAKIVGYYLSEGCSSQDEDIIFCLNKNEIDTLAKEIIQCMKSVFGIENCRIYNYNNKDSMTLTFGSKIVAMFLSKFCGKLAKKKFINEIIFNCSNEFKENLITSFINGDGHVNHLRTNKCIEIQLVNDKILRSMRLLLLEMGVITNFDSFNRKGIIKNKWKYDSDIERLRICSQDSYNKIVKLLNQNHDFNNFCLNDNINNYGARAKILDNMFYVPIKKIEDFEHNGLVYNISVEDDESYCTENFVVHNCLPLYEAAYNGLPTISTLYGGQKDFLCIPLKNKKTKEMYDKPLFAVVKHELKQIQKEAVWDDILIADSQWCFPDPSSYKSKLREVYHEYPRFKQQAIRLKKYLCEKFTIENQYRLMAESILGEQIKVVDDSELPKISIITSVFNSEEYMEEFCEDVVNQTIFKNKCEWVIVHPKTSLGFVKEQEVIKKYVEKYPNIKYIVEEEDKGLYWAWNVAIENSTGEYITNWNCDDRRERSSIKIQASELYTRENISAIYMDSLITDKPNETFENNSSQGRKYNFPEFSFDSLKMMNLLHANPMWKKELHVKYGKFEEKYRSAADWEFFLRCSSNGEKYSKMMNCLGLYYFSPKGISTDPNNFRWKRVEEKEVYNKYKDMKIGE